MQNTNELIEKEENKIIQIIENFCNENNQFLMQFKQDDFKIENCFDLSLENDEKLIDHSLFQNLFDDVINVLIKDPTQCIVDVGEHTSPYKNKSLKEIEGDINLKHNFTLDVLKEEISVNLFMSVFNHLYLNKPIFFRLKEGRFFNIQQSLKCSHCDKTLYFILDVKESKFKVRNNNEKYKCNELPKKIKFDFDVPSRKLVFVNDSRCLIEKTREDEYSHSICSTYGKIRECEEYLKEKTPYFSLTSGCAYINQKNEVIQIELNEESDNNHTVGSIGLDLWGMFIWDLAHFNSKIKEYVSNEGDLEEEIGDVCIVSIGSNKVEIEYNPSLGTIVIKNK